MKTRRVFTAFNQSAVFQEVSLSFMRLEDVLSAVQNHMLPQFECTFNAAKYAGIKSGVDLQRKRARYEKRVQINNKRLELAKAYREEEASNYFRSIAPLMKLFVAN